MPRPYMQPAAFYWLYLSRCISIKYALTPLTYAVARPDAYERQLFYPFERRSTMPCSRLARARIGFTAVRQRAVSRSYREQPRFSPPLTSALLPSPANLFSTRLHNIASNTYRRQRCHRHGTAFPASTIPSVQQCYRACRLDCRLRTTPRRLPTARMRSGGFLTTCDRPGFTSPPRAGRSSNIHLTSAMPGLCMVA